MVEVVNASHAITLVKHVILIRIGLSNHKSAFVVQDFTTSVLRNAYLAIKHA